MTQEPGVKQEVKGKVDLKKGFKSQADKKSVELRAALNLKAHEPLDAFVLAEYLDVEVFCPEDFEEMEDFIENLNCVSALAMKGDDGKFIIIHKSTNSKGRIQSDVMHELAHIICKHEFIQNEHSRNLGMLRTYNQEHENEAECLGATLQLPRASIVWSLKKGMTEEQMCDHFSASLEMVKFRINITGVKRQLSYLKR